MNLINNLKSIKRNVKKYLRSPIYRARFYFTGYYKKVNIDENTALFETYNASNFSGNIYYVLLDMNSRPELKNVKKYITCKSTNQKKKISIYLIKKGITNFEVVKIHSKKYCKILNTAKYLFNNATFPTYFIKKEGQVYFNSWHGTPLKTLGRSIKSSPNEIGNTQRNFFMTDYFLCPNKFTFNHMKEDYMLDNFFKGNYLIGGYPRNHKFYEENRISELRKQLNLDGKEVICYMPTWRGSLARKNVEEQTIAINYYLFQMNKVLSEEKVMYVKLHNFVSTKIDFDNFEFIFPFPDNYETYEFLSISDCLITDYSSVFFDYANLKKKIILFIYDKEEYLFDRGTYMEIESLPFSIVETVGQLHKEMQDLKNFKNYSHFIEEYCYYDNDDYARKITDLVFFDTKQGLELIDGSQFDNGKENVLIFGGSLAKNGMTTSLRGLLNHVDTDKYNYIVLFYGWKVSQNSYVISEFPKEILYIPIQGQKNLSFKEALAQFNFMRLNRNTERTKNSLKEIYTRELDRLFCHKLHFDYAIHFTGYEKQIANLFQELKSCKRIMYVHNDMRKEMKTRSNFHVPSITKAYTMFEKIVGVRDGMVEELIDLLPGLDASKINIVHNVNNIEHIVNKSNEEIEFDINTESTHTISQIKEILSDKSLKTYINVARFSPEKGIKRLVNSFEKFSIKYQDTYLIVIGGHGIEYDEIYQHVISSRLDRVILIKSLSNPFPILAKSDVFIMSSFYEGLPMSIMEALILKKPVISTDITGPREFLSLGYGYLVENNDDGIYKGFEEGYKNNLNLKPFDAMEFNKQALREFYLALTK